jgi:hypothetical protein
VETKVGDARSGWIGLAALVAAALAATACTPASRPSGRVLLVGLDGASWRVIGPLLEQERLPALAAIADAGVAGPLRSEPPLLSPRIWNTIATSKPPAQHGIEGWVWRDESGAPRLYASSDRRVRALWNIASAAGLRVGVVNWLNTHPPETVNGVMLSDHFLPTLARQELEFARLLVERAHPEARPAVASSGAGWAHPAAWSDRVAALREAGEPLTSVPDPFANDAARVGADVAAQLSAYHASDELVVSAALAIDAELEPELLMVYLPGIDKVSHVLWGGFEDPELYPEALRGTPEERAARGRALSAYYEFADALVGRLLERFADSDLALVVSDHGFEADAIRIGERTLTGGHESHRAQEGIVFARGRGIRTHESVWGMSIYDVTPTVLAWLGIPAGRDMQGRPARFLEVAPTPPVATHDPPAAAGARAAPSPAEGAIVEQLRELGYVE